MADTSPWRLVIAPRAERDLRSIPVRDIGRIRNSLDRLAQDPTRGDLRKILSGGEEWRLRVGDWRVRLGFDTEAHTIYVYRVLHQREAYR